MATAIDIGISENESTAALVPDRMRIHEKTAWMPRRYSQVPI
jgi:DNA-binding ferritin-like protein